MISTKNTSSATTTRRGLFLSSTFILVLFSVLNDSSIIVICNGLELPIISRRDVLMTATAGSIVVSSGAANAGDESLPTNIIDMDAINAARAKTATPAVDMDKINAARSKTTGSSATTATQKYRKSVIPVSDPGPYLSIRGGLKNEESKIKIPRVGYSFYITPKEQAARCTSLALFAGIQHLDLGSLYNNNDEIGKALKRYLDIGFAGLDYYLKQEKPELVELLEKTRLAGEQHALSTVGSSFTFNVAPTPDGSIGRRGRRQRLFLSHKISNQEQSSTSALDVQRSVKAAIATLQCQYLDIVSIHSPLTSREKRLTTYEALLDLQQGGFVKSVGVCNYGLGPLQEIENAGLDLPAVNQLELSPFNAHTDVVQWCNTHGIAVSCGAWSRLSSSPDINDAWLDVLSKMAQRKGMTNAQLLVRWALQKGDVCVPRSPSSSKIERIAIAQNSYGGVNNPPSNDDDDGSAFVLTKEEISILDGLDVSFKAGKLGRRDGWDDADVTGPDWDPTDFV